VICSVPAAAAWPSWSRREQAASRRRAEVHRRRLTRPRVPAGRSDATMNDRPDNLPCGPANEAPAIIVAIACHGPPAPRPEISAFMMPSSDAGQIDIALRCESPCPPVSRARRAHALPPPGADGSRRRGVRVAASDLDVGRRFGRSRARRRWSRNSWGERGRR